jgi:hypothetical protein
LRERLRCVVVRARRLQQNAQRIQCLQPD